MVRDYELMYIVRPDLDEDGLGAAVQTVEDLVTAQGGEVLKTTQWGKRRLAYEIQRLRDGHYVILHLRMDGGRVGEVERQLLISDTVIRHLVTGWVAPREEDGEREDGRARASAPASAPRSEAADQATGDEAVPDDEEPPSADTDDVDAEDVGGVPAAHDDEEE